MVSNLELIGASCYLWVHDDGHSLHLLSSLEHKKHCENAKKSYFIKPCIMTEKDE